MSSNQLVWLITGTSVGLGHELTLAALQRGDKVIAITRSTSLEQTTTELAPKGASVLELDVTSPLETLAEVAKKAISIYGRVDVIVNNAGEMLVGPVEENSPEESFQQFNANVFGGLNVARAFLPHLRESGTGTIVLMGSIVGWKSSPTTALYAGTKWALRGISSSLHDEISPFGLKSICVDFGYILNKCFNPPDRKPYISKLSYYTKLTDEYEATLQILITTNKQPGDPIKGVNALIDIVRNEGLAKDKPFSGNVVLGSDAYRAAKSGSEKNLELLEAWKDVSVGTDRV
ncbi:hypothetical protein VNI00_010205 [Paramarasmius palmivorus]|uniref:Uncharacterized protein n=1 Tax=Paramarasmius palmivorus TaxID=297713 RepID=A0AAW0CIZ8_9AGAR